MYQYDELIKMLEYASDLSKGVDPTSKLQFPEDTILNNKQLQVFFSKISELIDKEIKNGKPNDKKLKRENQKYTFYLSDELKKEVEINDAPISISEFTYKLNDVINTLYMKKIRAVEITFWLAKKGYLEIIKHEDGKEFKVVTEKGKSIGIVPIPKINSYGRKYDVNMYNKDAQKFILDNINCLYI